MRHVAPAAQNQETWGKFLEDRVRDFGGLSVCCAARPPDVRYSPTQTQNAEAEKSPDR